MRILLAQNSQYYPAHGGGDKSNRLLLEALAARGHEARVVARIPSFGPSQESAYLATLKERGITTQAGEGTVTFTRQGVRARIVTQANLRATLIAEIEAFAPDIILASTDDPAQLLLEPALRSSARVIYLARATLAVPFGPDCAFPSEAKTARIRACDAVVGVSQYVAGYIRRYAGIPAVHVPISLMEPEEWPVLTNLDSPYVAFVNPCAVKGIAIFLGLADAFPQLHFAAVPTWGTNQEDIAALRARPNVTLLDPVDDINLLLARTRVLLVPSLWAEARSRIVLESLLRGVPVMAANVGGIPEAMMGVPYLLPVNPIEHYETRLDEQMVPIAQVPTQDLGPWLDALARLTTDHGHYSDIAAQSRRAALDYARELHAGHFEKLLHGGKQRREAAPALPAKPAFETLSPDKRKLLALRLRKQATPASWFPNADAAPGPRLFCFPHAGGGTRQPYNLGAWTAVLVRLPGRESRLAEAPFERMAPLVAALADNLEPYTDRPFAFFGHSMGAVVAFELARELRRRGRALPAVLIASGARAPQFRRHHVPPPPPTRESLIQELRRLGSMPPEVLDDPALLRSILPALEADVVLYRNYIYREDAPLAIPIRAYGGLADANITRTHLDAWAEQTTETFAVRIFPGGHFYLTAEVEALTQSLKSDLPNVE
ncbi:MAG: alpha/beta fold hydrolase [Candidatus Solibacter sp.]